ncbi:hypothetical protein SRB17_64390 [Streptomyces sp. RB17]|nr:hypothetical protein [Streptomyces sp. RB17]
MGLQLGFLSQRLYSLMVVMAVVTTAMAGPLLTLVIGRPDDDLPDPTEAPEHTAGSVGSAA